MKNPARPDLASLLDSELKRSMTATNTIAALELFKMVRDGRALSAEGTKRIEYLSKVLAKLKELNFAAGMPDIADGLEAALLNNGVQPRDMSALFQLSPTHSLPDQTPRQIGQGPAGQPDTNAPKGKYLCTSELVKSLGLKLNGVAVVKATRLINTNAYSDPILRANVHRINSNAYSFIGTPQVKEAMLSILRENNILDGSGTNTKKKVQALDQQDHSGQLGQPNNANYLGLPKMLKAMGFHPVFKTAKYLSEKLKAEPNEYLTAHSRHHSRGIIYEDAPETRRIISGLLRHITPGENLGRDDRQNEKIGKAQKEDNGYQSIPKYLMRLGLKKALSYIVSSQIREDFLADSYLAAHSKKQANGYIFENTPEADTRLKAILQSRGILNANGSLNENPAPAAREKIQKPAMPQDNLLPEGMVPYSSITISERTGVPLQFVREHENVLGVQEDHSNKYYDPKKIKDLLNAFGKK